jgi:hypothetical protein
MTFFVLRGMDVVSVARWGALALGGALLAGCVTNRGPAPVYYPDRPVYSPPPSGPVYYPQQPSGPVYYPQQQPSGQVYYPDRPPVVVHQPPPVVVHQPRPPMVVHQPPPVVVQQPRPPMVVHQPPPVMVQQPRPPMPTQQPSANHDRLIEEQVRAALRGDRHLNRYSFSVQVINGVVMLGGYTDNISERDRAIQTASRVPGVRNVVNQITMN